jgi:hypothetical protein
MIRLLRNFERAIWAGNSEWIPESFDGLPATIAKASSEQVFDLRGGNLSMNVFNLAGQLIAEGNGNPEKSRVYTSPAGLQNVSKVINNGDITDNFRKVIGDSKEGSIGYKVNSIITNFGEMILRSNKILGLTYEANKVPQYYDNDLKTWVEGATSDNAPGTPSFTLSVNSSITGSKFSAGSVRPSGAAYAYRVVARNKFGRSKAAASITLGSNVPAGGSVSITITPDSATGAGKRASCYEIYSEKTAGSGDFKYVDTIAVNPTNPTAAVTYEDLNLYIPGTTRIFIVDQTTEGENRVMSYAQLLPIYNKDFAQVGFYKSGAVSLYGAMKYYKPNVLVEIRNIGVESANGNLFNVV